jgi:hypothetical protein
MKTVWQEHSSAKQLLQNSYFADLDHNQLKLIKHMYGILASNNRGKVYTYETGNVVADQCATTEKHLADIKWCTFDPTTEYANVNRSIGLAVNGTVIVYKVQWFPGEGFYSATYFSQQPV